MGYYYLHFDQRWWLVIGIVWCALDAFIDPYKIMMNIDLKLLEFLLLVTKKQGVSSWMEYFDFWAFHRSQQYR